MHSPFENGQNPKVFSAMLDLQFKYWIRRRYAAKKQATRPQTRICIQTDY